MKCRTPKVWAPLRFWRALGIRDRVYAARSVRHARRPPQRVGWHGWPASPKQQRGIGSYESITPNPRECCRASVSERRQRLGDGRLLCHRPTAGGTGRVPCSAEARRRLATGTRKCPDTPNVGAPPCHSAICVALRSLSDPRKSFPRVGGQRLCGMPTLALGGGDRRSTDFQSAQGTLKPVSVRNGMYLRAVFARISLRDLPGYSATSFCVIKAPLMSADPEFAAGLGSSTCFGCRYPGRAGDLAFGGCDAERTFPAERQSWSEFHGVMMRSTSGRRQAWGYGLMSCGN
jgi:hypothetical protein